ncbi:Outer membrane protein beta-barrel domain-containing protein [Salegentibacter holothuriorum]|uniref:Outer membrane protein beta-barrel domain-containing protein n=1 Tax=Salegentibacter holothuriorum TaxID=241145 RepID=A0A1T5CR62_9FLAO|nr:outer membrane beta-barrel protein [Salegentibacter holothuriorum]SKB61975.1 Outer membrane protein beta-barrel domain-containing protein [Salegentibacter holothuriorum]
MNRYFLLIFISIFCVSGSQAQEYSFGIKGGANYSMTGEIDGSSSGGAGFFDGVVEGQPKVGFHAGVFFELNFGKFFVRPEVIYNSMEMEFEFPAQNSIYSVEKLSIPLLFGYNIWGPIDVYAGPAYQNIMNATIEGTEPVNQTIVVQNTPLAIQAGAKVSLGRFELGLRYDRSMASQESQGLDFNNGQYGINLTEYDDLRVNQFLLSLSFKIGDSESNPGRRRGRGCYF